MILATFDFGKVATIKIGVILFTKDEFYCLGDLFESAPTVHFCPLFEFQKPIGSFNQQCIGFTHNTNGIKMTLVEKKELYTSTSETTSRQIDLEVRLQDCNQFSTAINTTSIVIVRMEPDKKDCLLMRKDFWMTNNIGET